MSRIIKFRYWYEDRQYMIDWHDDFFSDMSQVTNYTGDFSCINQEHLMQFTGLQDKNGNDIYELHEINNKYRIVYKFNKYVLQDISNSDIFVEINENDKLEITREYSPI